MPFNAAAWLMAAVQYPLEIKEAQYPTPGPTDLIVRAAPVAVNPMEYKIQDRTSFDLKYPTILGADFAGTVVEVGSDVSGSFSPGDRVIAHMHGFFTGDHASSAFQQVVGLAAKEAWRVPAHVPLEQAVVLPLRCETAIAGLFVPGQLGLSTAKVSGIGAAPARGEVLLIWGGSSSVGCCAIQLTKPAGYEVFATASKRNHKLCEELGATKVFDYAHAGVENEIIQALTGKTVVGVLDCIGEAETTTPSCARILAGADAKDKKVLVVLTPKVDALEGVRIQRVMIPELIGTETYTTLHAWLERALADGSIVPKPDPMIIGEGLEHIQAGIDLSRKGVSAAKIVVNL